MRNTSPSTTLQTVTDLTLNTSLRPRARLTGTSVAVVFDVDVNRVIEVAAELFRLFLGESVSGNDCHEWVSKCKLPFVDRYVPSNAWSMLMASLALVSK